MKRMLLRSSSACCVNCPQSLAEVVTSRKSLAGRTGKATSEQQRHQGFGHTSLTMMMMVNQQSQYGGSRGVYAPLTGWD